MRSPATTSAPARSHSRRLCRTCRRGSILRSSIRAWGAPGAAIAVRVHGEQRILVGPDNGLLAPAWERFGGVEEAVDIGRSPARLEPVSATFHGRDIFAPVAARPGCGAAARVARGPLRPHRAHGARAHARPPARRGPARPRPRPGSFRESDARRDRRPARRARSAPRRRPRGRAAGPRLQGALRVGLRRGPAGRAAPL